jgi:hypothetical protein
MAFEDTIHKGRPNGYAPLDGTGIVPTANLPPGTGVPTGTGFRHITSDLEDATAKLVDEADLSFTDLTTADATIAAHGLLPKLSGSTGDVLKGDGGWAPEAGGATPTGTGLRHVTAGVEDAAAVLIVNNDVDNSAAIAESKLDLDYATHSNANDPASDEKAALAGTSGTPSSINKYVTNGDSRMTDNRAPTAHSHVPADIDASATDIILGRATAGAGAVEELACTAAGRALIDDATAADQLTTLGAAPKCSTSVGGTWTGANLYGGTNATAVVATWNAVTNGTFTIYIDGSTYAITGCNFAACASMADVAAVLQTKIRTATGRLEIVSWSTNQFIFYSATTTIVSSVGYLAAQGTGTDISGAGATNFCSGTLAKGAATNINFYIMSASDVEKVFLTTGSTREVAYLLPTPVAGMRVHFIHDAPNAVNGILYIQTHAAGETIQAGAVVSSTYRILSATTKGNALILVAISTTKWFAESVIGTWSGI